MRGADEGAEANPDSHIRVGEARFNVPNQVGNDVGLLQDALKLVAQSDEEACGDGAAVALVDRSYELFEAQLHLVACRPGSSRERTTSLISAMLFERRVLRSGATGTRGSHARCHRETVPFNCGPGKVELIPSTIKG